MFTEAQLDQNGPVFTPGTIRYYYQDGADFFLFETAAEATGEVEPTGELTQCTYPKGVANDFDIPGAVEARDWFLNEWCPRNNVIVRSVP